MPKTRRDLPLAEVIFMKAGIDISRTKVVLVGSTTLYETDILQEGDPNDLDFLVDAETKERLAKLGVIVKHSLNGYRGDTIEIDPKHIGIPLGLKLDVTQEWPTHNLGTHEIRADSIEIAGLRVRMMHPRHIKASLDQFERLEDAHKVQALNRLTL
jgi:hypothetical protein